MKNIFVILLFVINILSADSKNIPTYMSDKEYSHYLFLIDVEPIPRPYTRENHIFFEENYVIVAGEIYMVAENKMFDEAFGIISPTKKTMKNNLSEEKIISIIEKDHSSYDPNNLAEAYKELLKAVYEIKNKNRVIDDVEFYNLVHEACLYDETVQKINDLAYLYSKQKNVDYKTLIEVYMDIIDYYPSRKATYLKLVDAYIRINDIEKAKQNYEKYIKLMKQDNSDIYLNLADFYSKQKNVDYELLIKLYAEIIRAYKYKSDSYLNLVDVYLKTNNKELARQVYKRYLKLMKRENKEDKIPKRVLKYLEN